MINPDDGVDPDTTASCNSPADCNDGLACTDDDCNAQKQCVNTLKSGFCKIGNTCYADGASNPASSCQKCDAAAQATTWSPTNEGGSCDDGVDCTHTDICTAGTCGGTAYTCSDGVSCTVDTCTGVPGGCDYSAVAPSTCLLGLGDCYQDGDINPANPCQRCDSAKSQVAWTLFAGKGCLTEHAAATGVGRAIRSVAFDSNGTIYLGVDAQVYSMTVGSAPQVIAGTIAGPAVFKDGPALQAKFIRLDEIAVLSPGAVVFADTARVRKFQSNNVTTIAGTAAGFNDGPAASAQFANITGLHLTTGGVLYLADSSNQVIRKIEAGVVSTVAGIPNTPGKLDGPVGSATLTNPTDVAVDGAGALWIADRGNNCVRKVSGGVVSSIGVCQPGACTATDGLLASARICDPTSLVATPTGVYVWSRAAGSTKRLIQRISGGQVKTVAGGGAGSLLYGPATSSALNLDVRRLSVGPAGDIFFGQTPSSGWEAIVRFTP